MLAIKEINGGNQIFGGGGSSAKRSVILPDLLALLPQALDCQGHHVAYF